MPEAVLIQPDRKFIAEVITAGGGDLKKCFQCATCSAVCNLSDGDAPFPRKEMHWAQWGLKDRLLADPDVWLCHQCNDCSLHCPRGARPGDVLAAVRTMAVREYARPRALAAALARPGFLVVAFLASAALLAGALLLRAPIEAALGIAGHEEEFYAAFFPHWLLIGFFSLFTGIMLVVAALGLTRFWRAMRAADAANGGHRPVTSVPTAVGRTFAGIFTHRHLAECEQRSPKRLVHLGAFYGFLTLFAVTVWAVLDLYLFPLLGIASAYPFGLAHPVKVVANLGGAALIAGTATALLVRRAGGAGTPSSTTADWYFLWLLFGVGVTGFIVEVFRFTVAEAAGGPRTLAYAFYFLHLVLVFQLLVLLPFTKFAHILYRTVATVYAERTGRHRPL